jgi:2-iminoacetate synthase ThiH
MFVKPLGKTSISLIDRPLDGLMDEAARLGDAGFGPVVTWSRKVFIPLTLLCRDTCRYCTFAKSPGAVPTPYLSPDEVLSIARAGKQAGCTEALFTLGDKPELRYRAARAALDALNGQPDLFDRPLQASEVGRAAEIAAAASLAMGQGDDGRPLVLMRGLASQVRRGSAADLVRPRTRDLFR